MEKDCLGKICAFKDYLVNIINRRGKCKDVNIEKLNLR